MNREDYKHLIGTVLETSNSNVDYLLLQWKQLDWKRSDIFNYTRKRKIYFIEEVDTKLCAFVENENYDSCNKHIMYVVPISELIRIGLVEESFKIPEKWCVKAKNKDEDDVLIKWRRGGHSDGIGESYMLSIGYWSPHNDDYKEITFEQFKKYILKENMETKEIIGYEAPCDMFNGHIKKGDIFIKWSSIVTYVVESDKAKAYQVPKEIVETWKPVYKDEKILLDGSKYEIEIGKSYGGSLKHTIIDGHAFSKEFWEAAKIVSQHTKASVILGCGAKTSLVSGSQWKVSEETIDKVLNKLK